MIKHFITNTGAVNLSQDNLFTAAAMEIKPMKLCLKGVPLVVRVQSSTVLGNLYILYSTGSYKAVNHTRSTQIIYLSIRPLLWLLSAFKSCFILDSMCSDALHNKFKVSKFYF